MKNKIYLMFLLVGSLAGIAHSSEALAISVHSCLPQLPANHSGDSLAHGKDPSQAGVPGIDSLFAIVTGHHPSLVAARAAMKADEIHAGTGITPPDPLVELGYLSGRPSTMGNRTDFRVTQEFDFPTAYLHRARMASIKKEYVRLVYERTRQEMLKQALELWIERIGLNREMILVERRLKETELLQNHYRQMETSGEVGRMELGQVTLQSVTLRGERDDLLTRIAENESALSGVTAGHIGSVRDTLFPVLALPEEEALLKAHGQGPEMQIRDLAISLSEREKQLAVSLALPKFSTGYYSESLIDEQFRGMHVGVSVPLWENNKEISYARAGIDLAEAEKIAVRNRIMTGVSQLLHQREGLLKRIEDLSAALSEVNKPEMLKTALELGEISLSEYIFNTEYYFQQARKLERLRTEMHLVENELYAVFY